MGLKNRAQIPVPAKVIPSNASTAICKMRFLRRADALSHSELGSGSGADAFGGRCISIACSESRVAEERRVCTGAIGASFDFAFGFLLVAVLGCDGED